MKFTQRPVIEPTIKTIAVITMAVRVSVYQSSHKTEEEYSKEENRSKYVTFPQWILSVRGQIILKFPER